MSLKKEVQPIAMPGIHQRFLPFFKENTGNNHVKVLDVGAGHGAFSKKLYELGYDVAACDMSPEIFYFDKIECRKSDLTKSLPYEDNTFDAIVALEVMEHILDHEVFFRESQRVLKPGGQLFISTPNILSLKSRVRFLFSGFFYSFKPLDLQNNDGLQHVASLTLDQYNYIGIRNGFETAVMKVDKRQSSSRWLMVLYPALWLYTRVTGIGSIHNTLDLLSGRILFLIFRAKK